MVLYVISAHIPIVRGAGEVVYLAIKFYINIEKMKCLTDPYIIGLTQTLVHTTLLAYERKYYATRWRPHQAC